MTSMRSQIGLGRAAVLLALIVLAACQSGVTGGGAVASRSAAMADIRASNGLSSLASEAKLERAALQQARYMASAGRMVHTTGWNKDFATRMDQNDVEAPAAENIAQGQMDVGRLFSMWMASPPHRKNILDPRMNRYGLASAEGSDGTRRYWALVLGR